MEWITANWGNLLAILFAIIRVVESVLVVWKNKKVATIINVLKEFFKLS